MMTAKELNPHDYAVSPEVDANLKTLLARITAVRLALGRPMRVTSGLRSQADQDRINPSALKSKHLTGQACDIADPDGSLKTWIMANLPLMESIGFWFEDFRHTVGWVHFQTCPPKSGKRFFIP